MKLNYLRKTSSIVVQDTPNPFNENFVLFNSNIRNKSDNRSVFSSGKLTTICAANELFIIASGIIFFIAAIIFDSEIDSSFTIVKL